MTEIVGGVVDRQATDALGSRVFTREGRPALHRCCSPLAPTELGFVVQHVEDDGFLRLAPVATTTTAWPWTSTCTCTATTGAFSAVSGATPFHLTSPAERQQAVPLRDLWVDDGHDLARAATKALECARDTS